MSSFMSRMSQATTQKKPPATQEGSNLPAGATKAASSPPVASIAQPSEPAFRTSAAPAPASKIQQMGGDRPPAPPPASSNDLTGLKTQPLDSSLLRQIAGSNNVGSKLLSNPATTAPSKAPFGAPPPTPPAPASPQDEPAPPAVDTAEQAQDTMWNDIMSQWRSETGNYDKIANEAESRAGRRAAAMNAAAGHGMGGGFAGGLGQASLAGQSKRMDLEREHMTRGLELQMTHLQDQLKKAEAAKDRQQAHDIQDQITAGMMELERIRQGAGPNANEPSSLTSGLIKDPNSIASDPAARKQAKAVFDVAGKFEKRQQAFKNWGSAPPELQSLATSYTNEDQRYDFMTWAYGQFLTSGIWPTVKQAREASVAGTVG